MRNLLLILLAFPLILISLTSCEEKGYKNIQAFDLKKIADQHSMNTTMVDSKIFAKKVLKISPEDGNQGIVIWEKGNRQKWEKGNYLVFEIYGDNDYSGVITIEFYKEANKGVEQEKIVLQSGEITEVDTITPWLLSLMGIEPRLKTKVVFPLNFLTAQSLFVPRSPRQLKGTITGNRLDPNDITKVILRFGPYFTPFFQPNYEIASISINDSVPEPYPPTEPFIDKFGQRKDKDWPGKIKNENDLIAQNLSLEKAVASTTMPNDWSRFGGWKGKRFTATGFFRTQHDGNRWWFVDPDGYVFLSTGVDGIRIGSGGPVTDIEDLFEWLPETNDPIFSEAITIVRERKSMDFYKSNMIRVYGSDWKNKWDTITVGLMKQLRFNSLGNWSDIEFGRKNKIPYVLNMNRFPSTKVLLYRDFPDVFSEEYQTNSKIFANQLNDYKNDEYMIGYFLRNEPQWAFGYHNIAYEMFGTNQQSKTKDTFVKWLNEKYNKDIALFNKAWALNLKDFDAIKQLTLKDYPSPTSNQDCHEFSTIMVKMYVDIPCDEVIKIDKNHLNLGMRYAWLSSDLLYKAGERFDVFSINGYGIAPPPTEEIARISGKPVIIGEYHHGAIDRALPATGIVGVLNQQQRADAYRNYLEQGFARPELIGMHYFQWIDQPFYGRSDGENYNIGVVTGCNIPYPELTSAMTISNERIYKVASGEVEPYKADIIKIVPIHY